jgi:hypothetical protein
VLGFKHRFDEPNDKTITTRGVDFARRAKISSPLAVPAARWVLYDDDFLRNPYTIDGCWDGDSDSVCHIELLSIEPLSKPKWGLHKPAP